MFYNQMHFHSRECIHATFEIQNKNQCGFHECMLACNIIEITGASFKFPHADGATSEHSVLADFAANESSHTVVS
jgi:hypothetical protein